MRGNSDMLKLLCSGTNISYRQNPSPSEQGTQLVQVESDSTNLRKRYKIRVKGSDVPEPISSFIKMKEKYPKLLKSVLLNVQEASITDPTPIQMQCLPLLLDKRSILACAPTGSGKTLCFVAPVLSHLKVSKRCGFRALILSPTRELAQQTYREFRLFGGSSKFSYHFLTKAKAKSDNLTKNTFKGDVLISTPKYLLDMLIQNRINLSNLEFCILDEADRLFDEQFKEEIFQILNYIDLIKTTVGLFSATLGNGIDEWCFQNLDNFVHVFIGRMNNANTNISQSLQFVGTEESKMYSLRILIQKGFTPPMLIFVQTKDRAKQVFDELKLFATHVGCIHSELSQTVRETAIQDFRVGKTWILICTDLMGRGIDFKNVNIVVNFDLPQTKIDYIHRIGRTGRAGRSGTAVTFFTESDKKILPSIISVLKNSGCDIPIWLSNMKGLSHRNYKKATKKPIKRSQISTLPKYDLEKAKKRKAMIRDSKLKKRRLTESKEVVKEKGK